MHPVWFFQFDSSSEEEGDTSLEGFMDESDLHKMVLIVNAELNMGVGKVGAQCAHAALGLYKTLLEDQAKYGEMLLSWEQFGSVVHFYTETNIYQLHKRS